MPKAPQRAQQRAPHVAPPDCQRRQCLRFQRIQALKQHKRCTQTPNLPPRQARDVIEARFKGRHRPQTYIRSSLGRLTIARRMGGALKRTARWSGPESVCKQPAARPAHALRTDVRKPAGRVVCYHTRTAVQEAGYCYDKHSAGTLPHRAERGPIGMQPWTPQLLATRNSVTAALDNQRTPAHLPATHGRQPR